MKCKKTFDARTLSREAKEQLRKAAVKRVESGESPEFVAVGMGINRRTIYRWLSAYHYGGEQALDARPIRGAKPKLDAKQMAKLSRIVRTKNPLQLKFEFALWTLATIRELIRREFGVGLSEVSVGRLMKRLGFTPQRPLYRAWQQDPSLVERWRQEEYPKIAARAKREHLQQECDTTSGLIKAITLAATTSQQAFRISGSRDGASRAEGHARIYIESRTSLRSSHAGATLHGPLPDGASGRH